ncbi:MAG: DUF11 domain-containing protein, partial [Chloroflexi bacterium]|nr:DUF11 domain-containing protein [Chloroflexota bacterium]
DPPSLAAPSVLPGGRVEWQVVFRDPRASGAPLTYTLGLSPAAGLSASLGGSLTLAPGEEVTRTLRVTVPAGTAPGEVQTWLVASAGDQEYRLPMWVHVDPPLARGTVLVIDNDFSQFEAYNNYTEYIEDALDGAGHRYTVWDADTRFGNPQTIPDLADLQEFSAVIWVTGDNVHPDGYYELSTPLTAEDQAILARFLDAGGRLLAVGQNLAEASDINPSDDPAYGRGPLLHEYLGAHWLAGSIFGPPEDEVQPPAGVSVVGLPGTFLEGVALDLGEEGDGAGNQTSVDEIAPGGLPDGSDLDHVQPVLAATGGGPVGSGYVGVAKACQPPLEGGAPACPYRTIYYAFGPEGINSGTGVTDRAELLDRSIAWLLDEVSVGIVEAPVGAPQEPILLRSEASSSHGEVVAHRWRVGDRVIDAAEPEVTVLLDAGEYPVRVRARDTLGHEATAAATLRVLPGGGSALLVSPQAANPGQAATYTVRLHNEGAVPLAMGLSLALPEDLEYVAHEGAEYVDGVLAWEGEVAAGATHEATLRVTVGEGAAHEIVATATISAGAETFTRSVRLAVGTHMSLPLIFRQGAP